MGFNQLVEELKDVYSTASLDGQRDIEAGLQSQLNDIARRNIFLAMQQLKHKGKVCQN
jgi:hypothetical protein